MTQKPLKIANVILAAAILALALWGCGSDATAPDPVTPEIVAEFWESADGVYPDTVGGTGEWVNYDEMANAEGDTLFYRLEYHDATFPDYVTLNSGYTLEVAEGIGFQGTYHSDGPSFGLRWTVWTFVDNVRYTDTAVWEFEGVAASVQRPAFYLDLP